MKTWLPISLTAVALMAVSWSIFAQVNDSGQREQHGFYVANSVFADGAKEPRAQSLTVFVASKVYDASVAGPQVVIFDAEHGQVVLLDKKRKVKTAIGTADLDAVIERLRTWCLKQADPVLRFCGKPSFKIARAEKRLDFRADEIEYLVDTRTDVPAQAAAQYRRFSDAMVGLAAVAQSSPVPPLPRLVVNRQLQEHGVLPASVSVKVQASGAGGGALHIRTHHAVGWQLRPQDEQLVREADTYERTFRQVNLDAYFGRSEPALGAR